jgi:Glycosyl transferase family 2
MSALDPTGLLFQLDTASAFALFWYVLVIDLPRYTLGFLAIAASELLRERQPSRDGYARPLVTVVLAGHNERKVVRRCVESLREQTHDRLEIICICTAPGFSDTRQR